jgi:hypothetical protein
MFAKRSLKYYKNRYIGETVIVCGLGPSLKPNLGKILQYKTIGVNDIIAIFEPTFHVVAEHLRIPENIPCELAWKRKRNLILRSRNKHLFSVIDLPFVHSNPVKIETQPLTAHGISKLFEQNILFKWNKSVIVAISLVLYMGFSLIGLIGIDLHGDRARSNATNRLNMDIDKLKQFDIGCEYIERWSLSNGRRIVNLSKESYVDAFDKVSFEKFERMRLHETKT